MIKIYAFLLILLLIIACSPEMRKPELDKSKARNIIKSIIDQQSNITTFTGSGRITIESDEFNANLFTKVYYNQNDSLLIEITGPLGLNIGTMFIGKSRFIVFNQLSNQFYSGSVNDFSNKNFLQFPLPLSEIKNFIAGIEPIRAMKINNYKREDSNIFMEANEGDLFFNIWISVYTNQIKKIEYILKEKVLLIKEYDKYEERNHYKFPRQIKFLKPSENQAISMYYNTFEINKKINPTNFSINIPDTAEQIDIYLDNIN